jgi:hypothetical protein
MPPITFREGKEIALSTLVHKFPDVFHGSAGSCFVSITVIQVVPQHSRLLAHVRVMLYLLIKAVEESCCAQVNQE